MNIFKKFKFWFNKNKKFSFSDWSKSAPKEESEEIYEKMHLDFNKTRTKQFGMEDIIHELGIRGTKEWFEKHLLKTNLNFRWTDANKWDKD